MFYSDLFELGHEAVGRIAPRLQTSADWMEPHREGVVDDLDDGRVRERSAPSESVRGLLGLTAAARLFAGTPLIYLASKALVPESDERPDSSGPRLIDPVSRRIVPLVATRDSAAAGTQLLTSRSRPRLPPRTHERPPG